MDADRFDRLTRSLTGPAPRRRLLGATIGGILILVGSEGADTKRKKKQGEKKCKKKKKCAAGLVRDKTTCQCVPPVSPGEGGSHNVCPEGRPIVCDTDRTGFATPHCCPEDRPVCCDLLPTCCWADLPVCCYHGLDPYCCAAGEGCCGGGGTCCPPGKRCVNDTCVPEGCDPPCPNGMTCCPQTSDGHTYECLGNAPIVNCRINTGNHGVVQCPSYTNSCCNGAADGFVTCVGGSGGCQSDEIEQPAVTCLS